MLARKVLICVAWQELCVTPFLSFFIFDLTSRQSKGFAELREKKERMLIQPLKVLCRISLLVFKWVIGCEAKPNMYPGCIGCQEIMLGCSL